MIIAVNSQERVLSIIVNIIKRQYYVKKYFVCETKTGHYSEILIMKAGVSIAARRCAFLSIEYYIQSITARQIMYVIPFI